MRENPIYTVTPPDMLLPERGPCITILSENKNFIKGSLEIAKKIAENTKSKD